MSNQTADRVHAQGQFVPVVLASFASEVLASKGIAAFQRLSAGQYLITLQQPLAFAEGLCIASLPANAQATAGAQLSTDGATVLITVLQLNDGVPVDPPFVGLTAWAVQEGEGPGPAPAVFPPIPPPIVSPGGGVSAPVLFGAASVSATTADRFLFPSYAQAAAQTTGIPYRSPRAGTYDGLRVRQNNPGGNGNDLTYALRVNGLPTVQTVTMASTDLDAGPVAAPVAVLAGDLIDLIITKPLSLGSGVNDVMASLEFGA